MLLTNNKKHLLSAGKNSSGELGQGIEKDCINKF